MATVLGLDLGSHCLKAVVLESSARGSALRGFFRVPRLSDGDRMETLKAAVSQLLSEHPLKVDAVVVALPGIGFATHALSLPFSDPKRIEQALPFEVEAQLPFDLSEAVYDYQLVPTPDKKGDLIVGVVKKSELLPLLSTLSQAQVEPRIVTHPALAFQSLLLTHPDQFEETAPVAVVDIGHERTSVAVGQKGLGLSFARTFAGGGRDLTRALATELNTNLADAEQWKFAHGSLQPGGGPEAHRAHAALLRGLQPLLRELRASFKAFTARTKAQVSAAYFCGGTSLLPGLLEQLSQDLGVLAKRLPLPNGGLSPEDQALAAQAYALAVRGQMSGAKAPRFNLRRGELSFKGHYDYLRERWGKLSLYAAVLLGLFIGENMLRNAVLSQRESKVDQALCQVTQRVLGRCERNFDRALSMLRGKGSPASALPQISAVTLLAQLTSRVPPDVPVKFDQVVIDLDRISLRGETDSSKQIDRVTSGLRGYRCFKEVKEGKVERSKDGQKVSFRLDIQVQCPEEGQG